MELEIIVEIPKILSSLKILDFKSFDNYIIALDKLKYLKNIFQLSSFEKAEKDKAQLSIEQITTILYMDALASIPGFKHTHS